GLVCGGGVSGKQHGCVRGFAQQWQAQLRERKCGCHVDVHGALPVVNRHAGQWHEGVEVGGQVDDAVEATTVGMDAVGKAFVINITSFRQVQRKQGRLATTGGDDGVVDRFQFRQVATKQNALGAG